MYTTTIAVLTLLTATHVFGRGEVIKAPLRVINGSDDIHSKYPYVVALKFSYLRHRYCTGTLIKENWVLTIGHCLIDTTNMYIQYGDQTLPLNRTKSKSKVLKAIRHPLHFPIIGMNDMGLALVNSVSMSKYGRLSAVNYRALMGHSVEYAGFGLTFDPRDPKNTRNKKKLFELHDTVSLKIAEAVIMSCRFDENKWRIDHVICVAPKCSKIQSTMYGDNGSPLFLGDKIIGVCQSTNNEGRYATGVDATYQPVSPYLSWLHKTISSHCD